MSPCNCDKNKINLSLIDDVLDEYAAVPGSLITILQKAQDIYNGYQQGLEDMLKILRRN